MVVVAASLSRQISLSSPLLPPAVSPWWRVWTLATVPTQPSPAPRCCFPTMSHIECRGSAGPRAEAGVWCPPLGEAAGHPSVRRHRPEVWRCQHGDTRAADDVVMLLPRDTLMSCSSLMWLCRVTKCVTPDTGDTASHVTRHTTRTNTSPSSFVGHTVRNFQT